MDIKKITNLDVKPKKVCRAVELIVGCGDCAMPGEIGVTPRLQKEDVQEVI